MRQVTTAGQKQVWKFWGPSSSHHFPHLADKKFFLA